MDITDIRIFIPNMRDKRLLGFATLTLGGVFVIKEIRILDGRDGWFISMPARKKDSRCDKCKLKNHLQAIYCNHCGVLLPTQPIMNMDGTRRLFYEDIVHPITPDFRAELQNLILDAYEKENKRIQEEAAKLQLSQVQSADRVSEGESDSSS